MSHVSKSLLKGAEEALAYIRGQTKEAKTHKLKIPKQVNVRAIRTKLHMTRLEFSEHFGFSLRTLEKWEQGVRQPEVAARAYLKVIEKNPKVVEAALREE